MSNDLAKSTIYFAYENIMAIFFVVTMISVITIYIIVNNISFKEKKTKVDKVITIENFTSTELKQEAGNDARNDSTCSRLKFKDSCVAGGNCVWVTAKQSGKLVEKCVSANPNIDNTAPGSDGPEKKCFKENGKLVPWEEFYYLDGSKTIKKPIGIKFC